MGGPMLATAGGDSGAASRGAGGFAGRADESTEILDLAFNA
jgi:hypothetical protein